MRDTHMEDMARLYMVLQPETELEHQLLNHPQVQTGMMWGVPRYGHPEGEVYKHVREVFDNIDKLPTLSAEVRRQLRLIALIHDTFKFKEQKTEPRNWIFHHAVLARRFMEQWTNDATLLNIIQYHDEAYYIWRDITIYKETERAARRMAHLLNRLNGSNQIYYIFFKCDSETGDKNPAPVKWVESNFPGITPVVFGL